MSLETDLPPDQLAVLNEVNRQVNATPYVPDNAAFGELPDTWKIEPDGKGFLCRDYALAKADALRRRGWPDALLSIVLCYVETGERHAVLGVLAGDDTTGRVRVILDNRYDYIYEFDAPPPGYRYEGMQVAGGNGYERIA